MEIAAARALVVRVDAVGDLVALSSFVERRRSREARLLHERCRAIVAASVVAARAALEQASSEQRALWLRRLRKLEDLEAYAAEVG